MQKENSNQSQEVYQYVGPYRLEKTLGKGQTGNNSVNNVCRIDPDINRGLKKCVHVKGLCNWAPEGVKCSYASRYLKN